MKTPSNHCEDYSAFDDPDLARRLVAEARRPDRLYPIRSNKYYGFYTGRLPGGHQAMVTGGTHGYELHADIFDSEGNFVGVERRKTNFTEPPEESYLDVNDAELHAYLRLEFGFEPGLIRIKRPLESADADFALKPLSSFQEAFLQDPTEGPYGPPAREQVDRLMEWLKNGEFALHLGNEYEMDSDGEVTSS
jgi:hypothetical protein